MIHNCWECYLHQEIEQQGATYVKCILCGRITAFRWTKFSRHVWEWFKTHPRWKRIKERWPQAQEWETAIDLHGSKVA